VRSSKNSFFASESILEDVTYRVKNNIPVSTTETLTVNGASASSTVITVDSSTKDVRSAASREGYYRKNVTRLRNGTPIALSYGAQAGNGGIELENNSLVVGNVYSNSFIKGENANLTQGVMVAAGPTGLVDGVHATSSVYAHTIKDSIIDKDAYYQVISGTTVMGTSYPGSSDLATTSLPISDAVIEQWKLAAEAGGVHSAPCPYKIDNITVTIGPKKINCELKIEGTAHVILTGVLWVAGNITVQNSALIEVSGSLGDTSVPVIADDPSNPTAKGTITLKNDSTFVANGGPHSNILMLSQNKSAENGGNIDAIEVRNGGPGEVQSRSLDDLLVYASHGEIDLENNIRLKQVTGYEIELKNNATVIYETGLTSSLFPPGLGGGYTITSWNEVE